MKKNVDLEISCNSNLAACYLELKKYKQCISYCDKVIAKDPKNIKALYRRGMAYFNESEFEKSQKDFLQMLEIDKTNVQAKQQLAILKKV